MDKNEKYLRSLDKKLGDILAELKKINRQNQNHTVITPSINVSTTADVEDIAKKIVKSFERLPTSEYL